MKEYLLKLLTYNLEPRDKALEYIDVSKELLEEADKELKKRTIKNN